ncbi:MAG: hypothetical protein M1834_002411 [Cirrosporium novae-zelandiae]|nr:MAG: hypothetical protein M1834_002411 [Cirrosporium novae-zelandiae]
MPSALQTLLSRSPTLKLLKGIIVSDNYASISQRDLYPPVCTDCFQQIFIRSYSRDSKPRRYDLSFKDSADSQKELNHLLEYTDKKKVEKPSGEKNVLDGPTFQDAATIGGQFPKSYASTSPKVKIKQPPPTKPLIRKQYNDSFSGRRKSFNIEEKVSKRERRKDPLATKALTFNELQYESDLGRKSAPGKKLVDGPDRCTDWELWIRLLNFRRRTYGVSGVGDIWDGIYKRQDKFVLPTEGPQADALWGALIEAGFENEHLLNVVCEYALKLERLEGRKWQQLYVKVIGHFIQQRNGHAYNWHKLLTRLNPPSLDEVRCVLKNGIFCMEGGSQFQMIYEDLGYRNLYNLIIPQLCHQGRLLEAATWHSYLMNHNDTPSDFKVTEPLLRHLKRTKQSFRLQEVSTEMVAAGIPLISQDSSVHHEGIMSREFMNLTMGQARGIAPKTINDETYARFFATRSIPVNYIISGLKLLGVEELGPITLRELVLREENVKSITERLTQFENKGISIGTSTYARVIRQLAFEGRADLLQNLLDSDLHPDAFDDWKLQEKLLASYLKTKDLLQFGRTMAILLVDSSTDNKIMETWNLRLRAQLNAGYFPLAIGTIEEMHQKRITVTQKSCIRMFWTLLRHRNPGRRPSATRIETDDLRLLITIWKRAVENGTHLIPTAWKEAIRRLGMLGRFQELESLCFWLTAWYGHDPLKAIFTPALQQAIVHWYFKRKINLRGLRAERSLSQGNKKPLHIPWTLGFAFLRKLEQRGVDLDTVTIERAFRNRLRILFGPAFSAIPRNRALQKHNPYTIEEVACDANRAWNAPLHYDKDELFWLYPRYPSGEHRDVKMQKYHDLSLRVRRAYKGRRVILRKTDSQWGQREHE